MGTVLRFLFVVPLAFVVSCYAASFALLWPFLQLPAGWRGDPLVLFDLSIGFTAQAAQIGAAALVPWALFMAASEILRLSSLLLHIAVGALAGLALTRHWYGADATSAIQTAMVAGGLAFFMVYWIVAGRRAGHWRTAARNEPRSMRKETPADGPSTHIQP